MEHFFSSVRRLSANWLTGLRLLALLPLLALATSCVTVTTDPASNITFNSAQLGGTAAPASNITVAERGVFYSPTISNPDATSVGIGTTKVVMGSGTGAFSQVVTGLIPNQLYYVRAYAVGTDGGNNQTNTGPVVQFTTADGPYLTGLSPANGTVGTSVTLTGTSLTGATGVRFNGTPATTFTAVNATTVTAIVPAGTTTGDVTVTTPVGTSNGVSFLVGPPTNNALAFDSYDDVVALGSPASLSNLGLSGCTFEAWVNINSTSGTKSLIRKDGDYSLTIINDQPYIEVWTQGTGNPTHTYMTGNASLQAGRWYHLAATWNGTSLGLYLNGIDVTSTPATSPVTASGPLQLGRSSTYNQPLNGRLDEVRIYNTPLTLAQVQADQYSANGASVLPASQKYYANFDQGVAGGNNQGLTSLPDVSGNGNTGTLTNFGLSGTSGNWVRSFPTIKGLSPTSGPIGSSVTVTGTNLTDATSYAFNNSITGPASSVSDLAATITVHNFATTGLVSLASAALLRYNGPLFTVTAGTAVTWTGATSTDWATAGNWTPNQVPDATVDATIPAAPGGNRFPFLTSGTANARNLTLNSGAIFAQTGGTLQLAGNLTNNGTFRPTAGLVNLGGTALSSLLGSGNTRFYDLTVGASGAQLSTSASTSVQRLLTLNGNLATNGNPLTLESNAASTALVVNNGSNAVSGSVTVQRYIDPSQNAGAGYRHYSAPVANTTVADLTTTGFAPVLTQAYNTVARPDLVTPFPNVFGYNQGRLASVTSSYSAFDKGWEVPAAATTALTPGRGYAVNIAGTQLVDFVGTLNNGDLTVALSRNAGATANAADAGWNLVGNPYPAPLDFAQVQFADLTGTDRAMYVFASTGPYAGNYSSYVNGNSTNPANRSVTPIGPLPILAAGQGFFVRVSAGQTSGSIRFRNAQRVTDPSTQGAFQRTTADVRPRVQLELAGAGLADGFIAYAEAGATAAFDSQFDAVKLPNPTGLNLSSATVSDEALAIDGQPAFTAATVLPLSVGVPAAGTYTLSAAALNNLPAGLDALLTDAATGRTVNLRTQPSYSFGVTAAQASALLVGRFTLRFAAASPLATAPALTAAEVSVFPNPARNQFSVLVPAAAGAAQVQGTLLNALGQVVRQQAAPASASGARLNFETSGLATGVYTLRLQVGATTVAKRVVLQ